MKFLVDENLPSPIAPLIRELGHDAIDVREIGLRGAPDSAIAAYARANKLCLITADGDFANIRNYSPREFAGIIVLDLPPRATTSMLLKLVRDFFSQSELIHDLSGRLAIVAFGRVRFREM
jgi:predicted nuclease of predicted toxin-antitoxin system